MYFFRKIKIAILSLLLPAMILLASNAVFNWHVHRQADGAIIVHAHPYQKTNNSEGASNHQHSSQECFSLQQFTTFLFSLTTFLYLATLIGTDFKLKNLYHFIVKGDILDALLPNRAPPVFA